VSEQFPEEPLELETATFLPELDDPSEPEDDFAEIEAALEADPSELDLVVDTAEPEPIGRSWAFDFQQRRFRRGRGLSPQATSGMGTLTQWIEKALRTARGAHPVSPDTYGMPAASLEGMIGSRVGIVPPDLEERVTETLLFHPRITAVRDFTYSHDEDEEFVLVSFVYEMDEGVEEGSITEAQVVF
jgi:hypothetical protein